MYIDYFYYILEKTREVLSESGKVSASELDEVLCAYRNGIPLIEPTPEKDHPARLRIGTSLAIHISKDFLRENIQITPEEVTKAVVQKISTCSDGRYEVSAGNGIFVNGNPTDSFLKAYIQDFIQKPEQDFFLSGFMQEDENFTQVVLEGLRQKCYADKNLSDCLQSIESLQKGPFEEFILLLSLLSNDEFDMDAVQRDVPFGNNPLSIVRLCRTIVGDHEVVDSATLSRNPYSKPQYCILLEQFIFSAEELIAKFRYFELQAALRRRPELLWKEVYEVLISFRSLWNDPWGRVALSSRTSTSDVEKIEYARSMCRSVLDRWESYARNFYL